jgi:integrase
MSAPETHATPKPSWSDRYGDTHRWCRFLDFPAGLTPPQKVRVYQRAGHFLLNWWDPGEKKNRSERVVGDLLTALARARDIDGRIGALRTDGVIGAGTTKRLGHAALVSRYLADLEWRTDAGEVDPKTVRRYAGALNHYTAFAAQPHVVKRYPVAGAVDRAFRLEFAAFLAAREVTGNGRPGTTHRMRNPQFVTDAVRGVFAWAADPDRGNLLPEGFRNPFLRSGARAPVLKGDPLAAPDITLPMAVELVGACDAFQLRLFVPLLVFGLRAAEPCTLFADHLRDGWLSVPCVPELGLLTKGRRDKRFPLLEKLEPFWKLFRDGKKNGLLLEQRAVTEGDVPAPLRGASVAGLIGEYRLRCEQTNAKSAMDRARVRAGVFRDAGGLDYDHVQAEFTKVASGLGWPAAATLKDLRHLFATTLTNAGVPEGYVRYLMGHAPGKAALVAYTHLDQLRRHYTAALEREWEPLLDAIDRRVGSLGPAAQ